MEKVFIPLILGTNREGRRSERVAEFLFDVMKKRDDVETKLFDVRDFKFPADDYGETIKDKLPEWRDAVVKSDGLIIITPEYNHSYPGPLKTALDLLFDEYKHKAVGVVGVSGGGWGGTRVIESLIPVVYALGLVTAATLNFPNIGQLTDEELEGKDSVLRANTFFDKVVWMAKTLKLGRENL